MSIRVGMKFILSFKKYYNRGIFSVLLGYLMLLHQDDVMWKMASGFNVHCKAWEETSIYARPWKPPQNPLSLIVL